MNCERCNKNVVDSDRITCRGFCGASFHMICVEVDLPLLDQLGSNAKNVFWMCDKCAELFTNDHFRRMTSRCDSDLPVAITAMKEDIAKLNTAISSLAAKVDAQPVTPHRTPRNPWTFIGNKIPSADSVKRRRGNDGLPVTAEEKPPSSKGTRASNGSIQTVGPNVDKLVWVYLSAFHPSTTDDDIAGLVRECIGLQDSDVVKVVKLVRKNADLSQLSFVTFKVGVDIRHKTAVLSPDSWPEDVSFREFVNYNSKNIANVTRFVPRKDDKSSADPPGDPHQQQDHDMQQLVESTPDTQ